MNSTGQRLLDAAWHWHGGSGAIVKTLSDYITIPNVSPAFDPDWSTNGTLDKAVQLFADRVLAFRNDFPEARFDDIAVTVYGGRDNPIADPAGERRTPLLRVDVPAHGPAPAGGTVILYGHLDKQPGLDDAWSDGLHPRKPVVRNDRLYGRGAGDDGYALWCALSALAALRASGESHPRAVIIIEAAEESGRDDLEVYLDAIRNDLGDVRFIVCLDSGCGDYDNLWTTDSLRGVVAGSLRVAVLREGVHSGDASGVVPSPFRIMRKLLSRLEDEDTGEILPPAFRVAIPDEVPPALARTASVLGDGVWRGFPFLDSVCPAAPANAELLLARGWKAGLVVKGLDGVPPAAGSGNGMLPWVEASLSLRLPPTLASADAASVLKALLEKDPPYNARVTFTVQAAADGWTAPPLPSEMADTLRAAAADCFGGVVHSNAEGGSIPFMAFLRDRFPAARFLVTGVLGPGSNAHGPDEFLHLPTARRLAEVVARMVASLS